MEVVIAAAGMPFGPNTLQHLSLGGSETAALSMAKELAKKGNIVNVFCNLPPDGRADHVPPGHLDEDKVRYMSLDMFQAFISNTEVDLLIVSRQAEMFQIPHQARKAVLWCHDLATYTYTLPSMTPVAWNIDEVWTVSEYHRQQFHKITGYPLEHIRATRNGVVPYDVDNWLGRDRKQLLYAARPERGLIELVRPGGIMSRLPEYKLAITMYDNFPDHMKGFYQQLFFWAEQLPNVDIKGVVDQKALRQLMADSAAYVYPTSFEEVSCIIGRECISQKLPFVCTPHGALPETMGNCAIYVEDHDYGSDEFAQRFADELRAFLGDEDRYAAIQHTMSERDDLSWEGVADQWLSWSDPASVTHFSRIWSMIEDSDVVPAIAYAQSIPAHERSEGVVKQIVELERLYPYLFGRETFAEYYERYFRDNQDPRGARTKPNVEHEQRFQVIASHLAELPEGAKVLDYGCAEGVNILALARKYKHLHFYGVDFAQTNIDLCRKYAEEDGITNVQFNCEQSDVPEGHIFLADLRGYDACIFSEVLEHVEKPWELAAFLEERVKENGRCIITVPQGPWEAIGLYDKNQYEWRAHIWHINKWMLRKMFADKVNPKMASLTNGINSDNRQVGHLAFAYPADHKGVHAVDPIAKAMHHRSRQSIAAAIIAKDAEETILKCLNSISKQVQQVRVALAPSKDSTESIIQRWSFDNPWIQVKIVHVPAVKVREFGFDDARNESIKNLDTDWIFWIDTDEYLSGNIRKYCRANAFDSFAIHQHHFTVEPRGMAVQLDKPARLFRNDGRFEFHGKVHEHAELLKDMGPGFCFILGDADIGHTGYVNENVRRDRFLRNFPLLEWDREVNPDRKLGKFLWLRDIIHRMRWVASEGDVQSARLLAEEAVSFYKKECLTPEGLGAGDGAELGYISEAREFLGIGVKAEVILMVDGAEARIGLIVETEDEFATIMKRYVRGPIEKHASGYWG